MNAVLAAAATAAAAPWAVLNAEPDPEFLRAALQRGLAGFQNGAHLIDAVRVSKVRRSASIRRHPHPITMCLELDVRDAVCGRCSVQRYYAKAFRNGKSAEAFASIDSTTLAQPAIGAALSHLGELDMLVWAWPNDPLLPQLAQLLDCGAMARHLPESLTAGGHRVTAVELLRYEPERRATVRCTLQGASATEAPTVVYGKTFGDDTSALTLLQRFEYFRRRAHADGAAPWVAEPLGCDRANLTFWQAAASGQPLMTLANAVDAAVPFARIGSALAQLHLAALPASASRSTAHWLAELQRRVQKISRAVPELANRAQRLAAALESVTMRLPRARQTLIHGDFHPEQVWLHGERIVFFDFDEFALGNPMEDLAEFIVKLEQVSTSPARCERQVEALTTAYRAAAPRCFDPLWLLWHRAMQTLLQASRAFIYHQPGWRALVEARLAASEHLATTLSLEEVA